MCRGKLRLPPLPTIGDIIKLYDLRARRQLSQNFLLEPRLLNKFARNAKPLTGCHVLEVGCGPGGITRELFREGAQRVVGIEIDSRFLPGLELLQDSVKRDGRQFEIRNNSAVNFSTEGMFPESLRAENWEDKPPPIRVIGNLPFHVATPLLMSWLHDIAERRGVWRFGRVPLVLAFQKELADRLMADIWTRQRGRPSIMAQYLCKVERAFDISGRAFLPKAQVNVTVLRLVPLAKPLIPEVPFPFVEKLVKQAFSFPSKNLVFCLETLLPPDRPELLIRLFAESGVQPQCSPRDLSLEQFASLCQLYKRMCDSNPGLFDFTYDTARRGLWHRRKHVQREILNGMTLNQANVAAIINKARVAAASAAADAADAA